MIGNPHLAESVLRIRTPSTLGSVVNPNGLVSLNLTVMILLSALEYFASHE